MSELLVSIKNLKINRDQRLICQIPKLEISAGQRLLIRGPNGSGKTTLLRTIAGLENQYDGQCDRRLRPPQLTFVHQSPLMYRGTVHRNVTTGGSGRSRIFQFGKATCNELEQKLFTDLGISNLKNRSATVLSGGEKKRVALARALAIKPKLLLLDEPFAELDDSGKQKVEEVLTGLDDTMAIVVTSPTHLPIKGFREILLDD